MAIAKSARNTRTNVIKWKTLVFEARSKTSMDVTVRLYSYGTRTKLFLRERSRTRDYSNTTESVHLFFLAFTYRTVIGMPLSGYICGIIVKSYRSWWAKFRPPSISTLASQMIQFGLNLFFSDMAKRQTVIFIKIIGIKLGKVRKMIYSPIKPQGCCFSKSVRLLKRYFSKFLRWKFSFT